MSMLDDLANPAYRPVKGPDCSMGILLSTVDKETQTLIMAAMANQYAPSTLIAEALTERNHRISANVVQRHRRGQCRCPRES